MSTTYPTLEVPTPEAVTEQVHEGESNGTVTVVSATEPEETEETVETVGPSKAERAMLPPGV